VSRSGQYAKAISGTMTWINTGAVTRLRDLDGDGVMDFYEDVLSDLPGAQGPDPLHQNNGIAFSSDGLLYTTVGAHSDRAPAVGKHEGTILRSRADGSELTVFAEGFRNPFDIVVGPDAQLFSTDNDANDRRSGDELNHVVAGAHYGFPYADGSTEHPQGTVAPLMVTNGSLQGITYASSPRLPEELRDCLYAVSYENGEIFRIRLTRTGDAYTAQSTLFARIPGAVDICVDRDGTFYISCFHSQTIYRLTYQGAHE
jgi:glucose/arabinose dehydrogenase